MLKCIWAISLSLREKTNKAGTIADNARRSGGSTEKEHEGPEDKFQKINVTYFTIVPKANFKYFNSS